MTVQGIGHLYVETHDWDTALAFWTALGFSLVFETDHHSGRLDPPSPGPYVFLAEVPVTKNPELHVYLDAETGALPAAGAVLAPYTATHWGTEVAVIRDPDGRVFRLERPE